MTNYCNTCGEKIKGTPNDRELLYLAGYRAATNYVTNEVEYAYNDTDEFVFDIHRMTHINGWEAYQSFIKHEEKENE